MLWLTGISCITVPSADNGAVSAPGVFDSVAFVWICPHTSTGIGSYTNDTISVCVPV